MIEARHQNQAAAEKAATPDVITTSMIINDLENGIDRKGIQTKYGLESWEVVQMFKHPALKGKKARKVKKMSFTFVDDTPTVDPNQTSIPTAGEEFHNRADLRSQDAIDHTPIEEENPHFESPQYSDHEKNMMQAEAWEQENDVYQETNPLNL